MFHTSLAVAKYSNKIPYPMKNRIYNYYVCSARFNGRGSGFAVGFDSRKAAYVFASIVLFGFAEVLTWDEFENRYPSSNL